MFGQKAGDALTALVEDELAERGMDTNFQERYPLAIVGYASLPQLVDSISEHGLRVFTEKATQRFKGYLFPQFLTEASLSSEGAAASMFESEWEDLMRHLKIRLPLSTKL